MDLAIREAQSMPWREVSVMEQRREFVRLAMQEGANRRELCRRVGIHPDTAYKWLNRWHAGEDPADPLRRPHFSPQQTDRWIEKPILPPREAPPPRRAPQNNRQFGNADP